MVGGSLNHDEMIITNFSDISRYMKLEIEEELNIEVAIEELKFFSLNYYNSKYMFLYTLKVPINSVEVDILFKEGEFASLVAMDASEVVNTGLPETDAFAFCKNLIQDIKL